MSEGRTVLVAGATGLVGGECVRQLVLEADVRQTRALVRRNVTDGSLPDGVIQLVTSFDALDRNADWFTVDHVFCALGTTIRKAGSKEAFRTVDYEFPLRIGQLALERGATHFLLVSAIGADPASRFFYSRTKGELERAIRNLGYRAVTIARPSFLLGMRVESRPAENIGKQLGRLAPARYRSVPARQVAAALIASSRADEPGMRVIENAELLRGS